MRITYRTNQLLLGALLVGSAIASTVGTPRTIDITADSDNRFKVAKQKNPVITMKVNEVVVLHITAHKGSEWDEKDSGIHTFTINALKDRGWDLRLKEGANKFTVVAPNQPGEYSVECTVKCGKGHDDMKMKLIVTQ
jgi:heme/copper-type cytochrome/quinol oxidase subunit 2